MTDHLCLTFCFLAPRFHGRGDEGAPEWPPSPLRAFQALVAAAARAGALEKARPALEWLEQRTPPVILAPEAKLASVGYRLSVPHNAMDLVGRQWVAGKEGNASEHRAMKDVRPHRLLPDDAHAHAVHYLWDLTGLDGPEVHAHALVAAARAVVALGWGLDLVVGDGARISTTDRAALAAPEVGPMPETWEPRADAIVRLRTPRRGSLADLDRRHDAFVRRTSLADPTLRPPPAISAFDVTGYARQGEPARSRVAVFTLMKPGPDRMRSFDTPRKGMVVAGMARHAMSTAAERAGWSAERIHGTVLGHGEARGEAPRAPLGPRFLLIPLPSIEAREGGGDVVTGIRRLLVASTEPQSKDIDWAGRALGGEDLVDEKTGEVVAVLATASRQERTLERYVGIARRWATVTPVVLPGLDDPGGLYARLRRVRDASEQKQILERLARRREALVRKALRHAGLPDAVVFGAAIETRMIGFFAGLDRADRYAVPQHLRPFPRLHVQLSWEHRVAGPICIGRGRFSGLGLFATSH